MTELFRGSVLILAPAAMLLVAVLARFHPGKHPTRVCHALTSASIVGMVASAALLFFVSSSGAIAGELFGSPLLGALLRADVLSAVVLVMVSILVAVIARYSQTYLDGDPGHGRFLGLLAATAASVELLVVSNHLVLFWVAWVATSLCLRGLLLFHSERPRAVIAARKEFVASRVGDALLALALFQVYRVYGTADIGAVLSSPAPETDGGALSAIGWLLAMTALLKSAQFPVHGWLVETMETPTPVSALLHAGVLNAGPLLILRFAQVFELGQFGPVTLLVVGGFTAGFASAVRTTQPSVKVALGYSSAAHMGFTLFVCGLGAYSVAALHLVAHSFYKAHAFLSAGSAVDGAQASQVRLSAPELGAARTIVSFIASVSTCVAVAWLFGITVWEAPALVLVGVVLSLGLAQLLALGVGGSRAGQVSLKIIAAAVAVAFVFFGLEEVVRSALASSLPSEATSRAVPLVVGAFVVLVWALILFFQTLGWRSRAPWSNRLRVHLREGFYANIWFDRAVSAMSVGSTPSKENGAFA